MPPFGQPQSQPPRHDPLESKVPVRRGIGRDHDGRRAPCLLRGLGKRLPRGEALLELAHGGVLEVLEGKAVRLKGPPMAQVVHDLVGGGAGTVEGWVGERVPRADQSAVLIWKPSATTRAGPSNRAGVAWARPRGMIRAWCGPRMHRATQRGRRRVRGPRRPPSISSPSTMASRTVARHEQHVRMDLGVPGKPRQCPPR